MRNIIVSFILSCIAACTHSQPIFDNVFIKAHQSKSSIAVPEVQELIHIIFAITEKGLSDSDMINHEGVYYEQVIQQFQPFASEPLVLAINKELKGGIFYGSRYARLKMDACGFYFEGDKIVKDTIYPQLNWDNQNYIAPYVQQLEAFALKTGFRKFYANHQYYYNKLIQLMHVQIPVQKIWHWLEARFPARYDNYWITFSPLANGQHSTNNFEANRFKQSVMFLCGPFEDSVLSPKMQEGLMSKVAFTEIDHNYVNPVTDSFKTLINEVFTDRNKWTAGKSSNGYKTPVAVFNEYMTYATCLLYLYDNFNQQDFEKLYKRICNQMEKGRGFVHFKSFADVLLALYIQAKQPVLIAGLYPGLLNFCKQLQ